ncbi:MAG: hypothetical protein KKB52_02370 [Candidatus Omnitrophica bacterium]|nr:hypothetical protein [Candidatus Omnitrophota bacterium]
MPYKLYYRPSFNRSAKRLGSEQKKVVGLILEALDVYYSAGCNLLEAQKMVSNFFYKKLRGPYYEAGVEKNIRIIIRKEGDRCIATLAGNHDQIKQFLANS